MKREASIHGESQDDKNKNTNKQKKIILEIMSMAMYLAIVFGSTYFVIHFVGQRTEVSGSSMESTLSDGDNLIVDKISYRFKDPERYDIIVFPYQYAEKTYYIKRIIGMPGESVQIVDGTIYINGAELEESYGREVIQNPGLASSAIELGENEYFVLGDNRNKSSDSREASVSNIKQEDIIGKAWVRIWPLQDIGILRHQ